MVTAVASCIFIKQYHHFNIQEAQEVVQNQMENLHRLGGLISITDRVGLSMSLPLLLNRLSSYSGVKTLLPLLVLRE